MASGHQTFIHYVYWQKQNIPVSRIRVHIDPHSTLITALPKPDQKSNDTVRLTKKNKPDNLSSENAIVLSVTLPKNVLKKPTKGLLVSGSVSIRTEVKCWTQIRIKKPKTDP